MVDSRFVQRGLIEAGLPRGSFRGNKADRREPSHGKSLWGDLPWVEAHTLNSQRSPGIKPWLRHTRRRE